MLLLSKDHCVLGTLIVIEIRAIVCEKKEENILLLQTFALFREKKSHTLFG